MQQMKKKTNTAIAKEIRSHAHHSRALVLQLQQYGSVLKVSQQQQQFIVELEQLTIWSIPELVEQVAIQLILSTKYYQPKKIIIPIKYLFSTIIHLSQLHHYNTPCQFNQFKFIYMNFFIYYVIDLVKNLISSFCNFLCLFFLSINIIELKTMENNNLLSNDKERQRLGTFQINPLLYLYVPILIVTPLYTYHMAISHKQQKPYPWSTVTMTACHYPQDIVFRYTMLIASSIITLSFYIIFRWLQNQCIRVGHRRLNKAYFYFTMFSMLCYSITIGTIDEKGIGKLHGPCAVIFFVIWVVVVLRITFFISEVRKWDTSIISKTSMNMKLLLAFYLAGVWVYCIYGLLTTPDDENMKKKDRFTVIVEWNSVLVNLLWVLSYVLEWRQFNFCLDFYPKSQTEQNNKPQILSPSHQVPIIPYTQDHYELNPRHSIQFDC